MTVHPHPAGGPADGPAHDAARDYELGARDYIASRSPVIGVASVERWAKSLPAGASVLDLGCGSGSPITRTLLASGLDVHALDASRSMVAAFRLNFPHVPVACETIERSPLFSRSFDAAIAWGLLFLLRPQAQALAIRKVADALNPGGSFLFTAPAESVEWTDAVTGTPSVSLGRDVYRDLLSSAGLMLAAEDEDEGGNHYFEARKAEGERP